jgi:hypothetical protein
MITALFFTAGIMLLVLYVTFIIKLWEMTNDVNEIKNYLGVNKAQMMEINKTLKKIEEKL